MQIQNNLASMNASRNQSITTGKLKKTLEKLSSGYRIVRAGDDAAGLAISEQMRNQINGLNQAMANINDGISLTNVGDGALTEVHAMLHRMKTLAVASANTTYDDAARANLDMERKQLLSEIDRISESTTFGSVHLFSQAQAGQIGAGWQPPEADDTLPLQIGNTADETLDVTRYFMGSKELLLDKTDFSTPEKGNASISVIENAIEAVSDVRASFGAAYSHLNHTHNNLSVTTENLTASESQIRDTDMAQAITDYTSENILLQTSNSMLVHANSLPELIIKLLQ